MTTDEQDELQALLHLEEHLKEKGFELNNIKRLRKAELQILDLKSNN